MAKSSTKKATKKVAHKATKKATKKVAAKKGRTKVARATKQAPPKATSGAPASGVTPSPAAQAPTAAAASATPPSPPVPEGKFRNGLIFGTVGVLAAIVFGLLYIFVISPAAPTDGTGYSLGWFLFSFAVGLTMIVMPCTLPLAFVIVPLAMGKGMARGLSMALAFGLGITVTLSIYGILAALLGGVAIDTLGADLESVKNWVYAVAGIFAFVFALSNIGLMKFHMPTYSGAAPAFIQKRQEVFKAFLLGLFLGNIGVGCPHPATPLILIEIASSGDVLYGWLMFLVHAIGRVLPLLLLAFLAILGVNGLNWLMTRKAAVERATGWAMVFVAGFILTLGLFTHDWWVNSGIHSALEAVTQESYFNATFNQNLGTDVAHLHGLEDGEGLFGLPLEWGHWFLVLVWLLPIWLWYLKRRKELHTHPSYRLQKLEKEIDLLEKDRRQVEGTVNLDEVEKDFDLSARHAEIDALEKERREAEERASWGESGPFKDKVVREYETKILGLHRNYLIPISILLILVFVHFMPQNFYYKSLSGDDHHGAGATVDTAGIHQMPDGSIMNGAGQTLEGASKMPDGSFRLADGTMIDKNGLPAPTHGGTPFSKDIAGLPQAEELKFVTLADGEEYDVTAEYVQKEVGNRTLRMMAYNRSIPGPFIKVEKDSTIYINFTNNTDIDQTIHSHGLRLDNNFDGVPYVTQDPVKPGQSFRYELYFKDEGMAWYHPHTRDDYGQEMGLYGVYLVDPLEDEFWNPVNREVPLVLDDILIENNDIGTFYKDVIDHVLLGRFGNEFMVNGVTGYELDVEQGETIRFQVTNVSNARTYRLSTPGVQMKVVGAEWGRLENEVFEDEFLISPSERVVFEAHFPETGDFELINRLPDRSFKIAEFEVEAAENDFVSYEEEFNTLRENETEKELFTQYRNEYLNAAPDKELLLTVNLTGQVDHSAHAHGQASTAMNPMMSLETLQMEDPNNSDKVNTTDNVAWILRDVETGAEGMNIPVGDWTFKQGDLVKIRLQNDAMAAHVMQHPIHLHGQRFVVLSRNGIPNQNMVWKDVAMVPPGDYIDILVDMDILGEWMAHCHISEHLHGGMMMQYRVEDESGYATGDEYRAALDPSMQHGSADTSSADSNNVGMTTSGDQSAIFINEGAEQIAKYSFDTDATNIRYHAFSESKFFQAQKRTEISLSIFDENNDSVLIADRDKAMTVTFASSDGLNKVFTFPGNTAFQNYGPPQEAPRAPQQRVPADDGHDHMHMKESDSMFALIPTALAHGGIDDGHIDLEGNVYTYTMPIVFPDRGFYRAFVEFIPEGSTEIEVVSFDIEVAPPGFTIDSLGWTLWTKWLILFTTSVILMSVLSLVVYRYLKVAEIKGKKV